MHAEARTVQHWQTAASHRQQVTGAGRQAAPWSQQPQPASPTLSGLTSCWAAQSPALSEQPAHHHQGQTASGTCMILAHWTTGCQQRSQTSGRAQQASLVAVQSLVAVHTHRSPAAQVLADHGACKALCPLARSAQQLHVVADSRQLSSRVEKAVTSATPTNGPMTPAASPQPKSRNKLW